MATLNQDIALKFQTTKDGDIEETQFAAGADVEVVQEWDDHVLIKDDDGHFYTVAKSQVTL